MLAVGRDMVTTLLEEITKYSFLLTLSRTVRMWLASGTAPALSSRSLGFSRDLPKTGDTSYDFPSCQGIVMSRCLLDTINLQKHPSIRSILCPYS